VIKVNKVTIRKYLNTLINRYSFASADIKLIEPPGIALWEFLEGFGYGISQRLAIENQT
jgi:hypothetical protein